MRSQNPIGAGSKGILKQFFPFGCVSRALPDVTGAVYSCTSRRPLSWIAVLKSRQQDGELERDDRSVVLLRMSGSRQIRLTDESGLV